MNAKVHQITLVVTNQKTALEFYTKKVGFEIKTDFTPPGSYRWITVGPKGQDLEIALYEEGNQNANDFSSNWKPGECRQ